MDLTDKSVGQATTGGRKREFVFILRPAQMAGGIVMLCLGFATVFFLGVVLGRGYTPESGIPELARLMPEASAPVAPRIVAPEEDDAAEQSAAPPPGQGEEGTFTRADLDYRDHLKSGQPAARSGVKPGDDAGRSARDKKTDGKGGPQARKSENKNMAAKESASAKGGKKADSAPDPDAAVYHYVYQAASYKDRATCDKFTSRLRAAGFTVRTEQAEGNGVTWFRTMVEFTGRPDDTDAMRDKLKNFGVPRALLRSKTPATRNAPG
ncbi:MAG: SPOR domain-containing protein [Desulfovibrio sp.]|jgi:hypothetical protein|nr:SPOR domain-containing protein [Desulfovibrio sp.]